MINATKYRKKPVVIEAMQWAGTAETATPIIDWVLSGDGIAHYWDKGEDDYDLDNASIHISTLEGFMRASPGDFIIRGVQGEFYPCRSDIFEMTYEVASEEE